MKFKFKMKYLKNYPRGWCKDDFLDFSGKYNWVYGYETKTHEVYYEILTEPYQDIKGNIHELGSDFKCRKLWLPKTSYSEEEWDEFLKGVD